MNRKQARCSFGGVLLVAAVAYVSAQSPSSPMDSAAQDYVKLVLAVGIHDADYVDAYYGPPEWRTEAAAARRSIRQLDRDAWLLLKKLQTVQLPSGTDEIERQRHYYLTAQLGSLRARLSMLRGKRFTFDEESLALYHALARPRTTEEFENVLADLARRLPGEGAVWERYEEFRSRFEIPQERLHEVFTAAIDGCRARTLEHIELPPDESFTIEYVTG